jgi:hypothetical protein
MFFGNEKKKRRKRSGKVKKKQKTKQQTKQKKQNKEQKISRVGPRQKRETSLAAVTKQNKKRKTKHRVMITFLRKDMQLQ